MNQEAHLLLFFDIENGVPIYRGVGIYGEDADSITSRLDGNSLIVTGASRSAPTYDEAKNKLKDLLKVHPFYRTWIHRHISLERRT